MTTTHTPGPWDFTTHEMYGKTVFFVTQVNKAIHSPNYSDVVVVLVAETVKAETLAIKTADANLIAAAPELLVALQGLLDSLEIGGRWSGPNITTARAAITKATGGES